MPIKTAEQWLQESVSLRQRGDHEGAIEACRTALGEFPGNAQLLASLAHALRFRGFFAEALTAATQAIGADPLFAGAWFNRGAAAAALRDTAGAVEDYRHAIALNPGYAEAWSNLGSLLEELGRMEEAVAAHRSAVAANPALAPAWSNLCRALTAVGDISEAVAAGRKAVAIDGRFAPAWVNLGHALQEAGEDGDALEALQAACRIAPALAEAHLGVGLLHKRQGRDQDALAAYRRALSLKPGLHDAAWALSLLLLAMGNLPEGWALYEARWRRSGAPGARYPIAGQRLGGRVLVWSEQGIGDEVLFASMAQDARASAQALTWEADPRLVPLFQRSFPTITVVPRSDPPHADPRDFDAVLPAGSLGAMLRASFDRFPRHRAFLIADPDRSAELSSRLRAKSGDAATVGISWASKNVDVGDRKTLPLSGWQALLTVPGVQFVSLQYGDTAAERTEAAKRLGVQIRSEPDVDLFNDMDGLAALIAACDLVITTSNVTAHVAGALGKAVWTLLPLRVGRPWCWFSGRPDSPWYPSMRLVSQREDGDWGGLMDNLAQELRGWATRRDRTVQ